MCSRLFVICICTISVLFTATSTQSQATNPTVAACGLPTGGSIVADVTYTLTANCTQASSLIIQAGISVTINGAGYEIDGAGLSSTSLIIDTTNGATLNISNATIVGGGSSAFGAIRFRTGTYSLSNVTMREFQGSALWMRQGSGTTVTLSNMLFEDGSGRYNSPKGFGSVIEAANAAVVTVTNMVVRDVVFGNAALNVGHHSSLTLNGCLTMDRIFPQNMHADANSNGSITDNSTGTCSGTIGNGGSATRVVPPPQPAACGLPAQGFIASSATYNLTGTCVQTGPLYMPLGVNVTINGNWNHITGDGSRFVMIAIGDGFSMSRILVRDHPWYAFYTTLDQHPFAISETTFRNLALPLNLFAATGTLKDVVFEDIDSSFVNSVTISGTMRVMREAKITATDVIMRRNTASQSLVYVGNPNTSLTLEGCFSSIDNTPDAINVQNSGVFTDNSTGPCPEFNFPFVKQTLPVANSCHGVNCPDYNPHPYGGACANSTGLEAIPVGSIACLFRQRYGGPNTVMSVYGVDEHSRGFHLLTVAQAQLDAVAGQGVVAVSPDGRALVVKWADNNVTVKVGPDHEDKILHVTMQSGLYGPVIGTITTYGEAPGLPWLGGRTAPAQTQGTSSQTGTTQAQTQPQATHSQTQAVERALQNCRIAPRVLLNLRRQPHGTILGTVSSGEWLPAMARKDGWFRVNYNRIDGWLSADYVSASGNCA